jgi:GNAT superfamily N-acetyltransferase
VEDEKLGGYLNPKLNFYFTPITMECFFTFTFEKKHSEAVNPETLFEEFFLNGLVPSRAAFEQKLAKQSEFNIPGKDINSIKQGGYDFDTYLIENVTKPDVNNYNKNIQIFLKFFIETGSYIDDEDPAWKLLLLIERKFDASRQREDRTFVGFVSYYPFYREYNAYRLRISQQVILPCFQRKGLGSHLLNQIYQHYRSQDACYEITIEAPSEGFQLMKDGLDLKILLPAEEFKTIVSKISSEPLRDAKAVYDCSRILNKDGLERLNKETKIRKAQISRVFDLILLLAIDEENITAVGAYEGYLRKKIEKVSGQQLFSQVKEKYIEVDGVVEKINYNQFTQNSKMIADKFDEIFKFTLAQYQRVLKAYRRSSTSTSSA